jgi:predicted CoA-binding protein
MIATDDPQAIRDLLEDARVIAVVGHSDRPERESYRIGLYLRRAGYRVYAVNPTLTAVLGEPVYPDLASVPEPIDIVDVFRRSEHVPGIVDDAIAVGAKAIWLQLGIAHAQAVQRAVAAGLTVVTDRCIMVEHQRLFMG